LGYTYPGSGWRARRQEDDRRGPGRRVRGAPGGQVWREAGLCAGECAADAAAGRPDQARGGAPPRRAARFCARQGIRVTRLGHAVGARLAARRTQGSHPARRGAAARPRAPSELCAAGAQRARASARGSCGCWRVAQGGLAAVPLEEAQAALLRKWRATDGGDLPACMPHGSRTKPARPAASQGLHTLSLAPDAPAALAAPQTRTSCVRMSSCAPAHPGSVPLLVLRRFLASSVRILRVRAGDVALQGEADPESHCSPASLPASLDADARGRPCAGRQDGAAGRGRDGPRGREGHGPRAPRQRPAHPRAHQGPVRRRVQREEGAVRPGAAGSPGLGEGRVWLGHPCPTPHRHSADRIRAGCSISLPRPSRPFSALAGGPCNPGRIADQAASGLHGPAYPLSPRVLTVTYVGACRGS